MAVLRFDPNAALEVALKYDGGKQVKSRIPDAPDQMMFTVCGDDTIYVPLHVAEQIEKLGIKKLELISICKTVKQNVTRWEVKRLSEAAEPPPAPRTTFDTKLHEALAPRDNFERLPTAIDATPTERKLTESINIAREKKAQRASSLQDSPAAPQPSTPEKQSTAPIHVSACATLNHANLSQLLSGCMMAAIDSAVLARQYAYEKGLSLEFSQDSIQDLTSTLMIHMQKMADLECRYDVKGIAANMRMNQGGASQWRQ